MQDSGIPWHKIAKQVGIKVDRFCALRNMSNCRMRESEYAKISAWIAEHESRDLVGTLRMLNKFAESGEFRNLDSFRGWVESQLSYFTVTLTKSVTLTDLINGTDEISG
jgi:hypothetical protein